MYNYINMDDVYRSDIFHSFNDDENIYDFKSIDELDRYEERIEMLNKRNKLIEKQRLIKKKEKNDLIEKTNLQVKLLNKIKKNNWITKIKNLFKNLFKK